MARGTQQTTFSAQPAIRRTQAQPQQTGLQAPGRGGQALGQAIQGTGQALAQFAERRREFNRQRETKLFGITANSSYSSFLANLEEQAKKDPHSNQSEVWQEALDTFKADQAALLSEDDPFRNEKLQQLEAVHAQHLGRAQSRAVRYESEAFARNAVEGINKAFQDFQSSQNFTDFTGRGTDEILETFNEPLQTLAEIEETYQDNPQLVDMARKRVTAQMFRTANRSDVTTEAAERLVDQISQVDPNEDYSNEVERTRQTRVQIDARNAREAAEFAEDEYANFIATAPGVAHLTDANELREATNSWFDEMKTRFGVDESLRGNFLQEATNEARDRAEEVRLDPSASRQYAMKTPEAQEISSQLRDSFSQMSAAQNDLQNAQNAAEREDALNRLERYDRESQLQLAKLNDVVSEKMQEIGGVSIDDAWNIPEDLNDLLMSRLETGSGFERANVAKAISQTLHSQTQGWVEANSADNPQGAALVMMAHLDPMNPNIEVLADRIAEPKLEAQRNNLVSHFNGNEERADRFLQLFDQTFTQSPFYRHMINSDNNVQEVASTVKNALKSIAIDNKIRYDSAPSDPEQGGSSFLRALSPAVGPLNTNVRVTESILGRFGIGQSERTRPIEETMRAFIGNSGTVVNVGGRTQLIPNRSIPYQGAWTQMAPWNQITGVKDPEQLQEMMNNAMELTFSRQEYGGVAGWLELSAKELTAAGKDIVRQPLFDIFPQGDQEGVPDFENQAPDILDWEEIAQGNANIDFSHIMLPATDRSKRGRLSEFSNEEIVNLFGRQHAETIEDLIVEQEQVTAKFHEDDQGEMRMYFYWKGGTYDPRREGQFGEGPVRQIQHEPMWFMDEEGNKTEQVSVSMETLLKNGALISNHRRARVERAKNAIGGAVGEIVSPFINVPDRAPATAPGEPAKRTRIIGAPDPSITPDNQ